MSKQQTLDDIRNYYGVVLQSSSDLKTGACCTIDAMPAHLRQYRVPRTRVPGLPGLWRCADYNSRVMRIRWSRSSSRKPHLRANARIAWFSGRVSP